MERAELVERLQEGPLTVIFTKVDGSLRTMLCTLESDVLPPFKGSVSKRSQEVLPVWDLEANGWRSFRLDSIKEVK